MAKANENRVAILLGTRYWLLKAGYFVMFSRKAVLSMRIQIVVVF